MKLLAAFLFSLSVQAKEIALTFDDSPKGPSGHFGSIERTETLIRKLAAENIPAVMIFANPCMRKDTGEVLQQLSLYKKAGHRVENHTCTHPRLDDVGFDSFKEDFLRADLLLKPLSIGQKFFRFPFLNEGREPNLRDQVRKFLKENDYRNGMVSVDNDDYQFSFKVNEAKRLGKKIDYDSIKDLFVDHIIGAAEYYDQLSKDTLGYSPRHVLLLHEFDITVMFIEDAIRALRQRGWKIISAQQAFEDPLYQNQPKSTYANNGIIAQIHHDKTGVKKGYFVFEELNRKLDDILAL